VAEGDFVKVDDLGAYLAAVKAGEALRGIEMAPGWWTRFVWPAAFVFAIGNQLFNLVSGRQHLDFWQCGILVIYAAGLLSLPATIRRKLQVSTVGVEVWSGFKRRLYQFADMKGPFTLAQRKVFPGFDIMVPVAGAAPVKLVPPRWDIVDTQLIELLNMYRAGFEL